jgi:dipeptidyl aminopeptidase/acylaminoacyl peptidase
MNRNISIFLILIACLTCAYYLLNKSNKPDGYIVSEEPWGNVPKICVEASFSKIRTMSDGLEVVALLAKPKEMAKKKYPVVILNRGGNREFGKIEKPTFFIYELVKSGYIVLASQYRGNDGSQGKEQFGGDDVHDVLNLIKTAHHLPYADTKNIFMIGVSRGGMMTYLALKEQPPIKAAVVIAGPTDLFALALERPEMEKHVFEELIPNIEEKRSEQYTKRSAIFWPEKINVPLLIVHGKQDEQVDISHSYAMADKLKKLKKNYLLLQHEKGHTPTTESIKDIIDWINSFD